MAVTVPSFSTRQSSSPLATFHAATTPSKPPEMPHLPFGLNATALTRPECSAYFCNC